MRQVDDLVHCRSISIAIPEKTKGGKDCPEQCVDGLEEHPVLDVDDRLTGTLIQFQLAKLGVVDGVLQRELQTQDTNHCVEPTGKPSACTTE